MIVSLALAAALAVADDDYDSCMASARSNPDFASCGAGLVARSEAKLNRVWKAAYAPLDAETKAALLDEQRLWIAFKDKSCAYLNTGAFGREGQAVHSYACRAALIEERIAYLAEIGDTIGPDRRRDIATGRE